MINNKYISHIDFKCCQTSPDVYNVSSLDETLNNAEIKYVESRDLT